MIFSNLIPPDYSLPFVLFAHILYSYRRRLFARRLSSYCHGRLPRNSPGDSDLDVPTEGVGHTQDILCLQILLYSSLVPRLEVIRPRRRPAALVIASDRPQEIESPAQQRHKRDGRSEIKRAGGPKAPRCWFTRFKTILYAAVRSWFTDEIRVNLRRRFRKLDCRVSEVHSETCFLGMWLSEKEPKTGVDGLVLAKDRNMPGSEVYKYL